MIANQIAELRIPQRSNAKRCFSRGSVNAPVIAEFNVLHNSTAGMLQVWNRACGAGAVSIVPSTEPDCVRFVIAAGYAEWRMGHWVPKAPLLPTLNFPHWMDSPSAA